MSQLSINKKNDLLKIKNDTTENILDSIKLKPVYFKVNIILPGFSVEKSIFNYKSTINLDYGILPDLLSLSLINKLYFLNFINAEYRYYYNINKKLIGVC